MVWTIASAQQSHHICDTKNAQLKRWLVLFVFNPALL